MNKEDLIKEVKQTLGWPTIELELEESFYDFAVKRALQNFNRFAFGEGSDVDWLVIDVSAGTSAYQLDDNVRGVIEGKFPDSSFGNVSELFTYENLLWNTGALNVWSWGSFSLVSYELALGQIDLIRQMVPSPYNVVYRKEENQMTIHPPPSANNKLFCSIYKSTPASALYDNEWVHLWTKAECMEAIGHIRGKYGSLPGPGGQVNFGVDMLREGQNLKAELSGRLFSEYQPPFFFTG